MAEISKKWGTLNGFAGQPGGWIYDSKGQHIAHGWIEFFYVYGPQIRNWAVSEGLINRDQKLA